MGWRGLVVLWGKGPNTPSHDLTESPPFSSRERDYPSPSVHEAMETSGILSSQTPSRSDKQGRLHPVGTAFSPAFLHMGWCSSFPVHLISLSFKTHAFPGSREGPLCAQEHGSFLCPCLVASYGHFLSLQGLSGDCPPAGQSCVFLTVVGAPSIGAEHMKCSLGLGEADRHASLQGCRCEPWGAGSMCACVCI